jgi:hypothetical protein
MNQIANGSRTHDFLHDLAILQYKDAWNTHDLELFRKALFFVDIHFANHRSAFEILMELVDDGCNHSARAAPGSPEIKQNRFV